MLFIITVFSFFEVQSYVLNNSWVSKIFGKSRVIRQWYPLSALLFLLSVDDMALRMQINKDMKGITIQIYEKHHSIKHLQFANDITLFISLKEKIFICS